MVVHAVEAVIVHSAVVSFAGKKWTFCQTKSVTFRNRHAATQATHAVAAALFVLYCSKAHLPATTLVGGRSHLFVTNESSQ